MTTDRRQETLQLLSTTNPLISATSVHLLIPAELTSSAEIDRPTNRSSTFQRAGGQLLSDVQVTHLEQHGKGHFFPPNHVKSVTN